MGTLKSEGVVGNVVIVRETCDIKLVIDARVAEPGLAYRSFRCPAHGPWTRNVLAGSMSSSLFVVSSS